MRDKITSLLFSPTVLSDSKTRIILISLAFIFLTAEAPGPWGIDELVGKKAPDFTLTDINGKSISISSLKGRAVIINFWATWCPPCRAEMPSLNRLYKEYKTKGLVVLAISTDTSASAVKGYLSKYPFDFTILLDTDNRASRQFRIFSIPTSFLIDKNSVIIQRFIGEEDWETPEIKSKVKEVLGIH